MKKLLFIFLLISSFAHSQIIKQKQVLGLQDSLTAIRAAGGAGTSPVGVDSLTGWALQFANNNVSHGYFWNPVDSYGAFFNEVWIVPELSGADWTGYYISAGYGGSHFLLAGVSMLGGYWKVTGNIYPGTGTIGNYTWSGIDVIKAGTLHHIAISYDRTKLVVYIDGIPTAEFPYTALRTLTAGSNFDSYLFTGGSDHSFFYGKVLRMRHMEGAVPFIQNIVKSFSPHYTFDGAIPSTVLNVDYTIPGNSIVDMSDGFLGIKHNGFRNAMSPLGLLTPYSVSQWLLSGAVDGRPDSLLPQWVRYIFKQTPYSGTTSSVPGGAVAFDDFTRQDATPAFNSIGMDSTMGGSAGKQKWFAVYYNTSILNEQAIILNDVNNPGIAYTTVGSSNQDVRVTQTIGDKKGGVLARYTDANNFIVMSAAGGTTYISKRVAGSYTTLGTFATGSFTVLRLVVSGSTWTAYEDGVSKATGSSIADVPLGTKAGLSSSDYSRFKKFEVY